MLNSCPPSLKDTLLRLLANNHFVEAKTLLDEWRANGHYAEMCVTASYQRYPDFVNRDINNLCE